MTYISGTVTDAAPGPALHTALATTLTAVGFTLVDTVVISTRTHKIWKCAAANNSLALDWYLDIVYTTTGAGTIAICPFEFFDPATDLAYRGPTSGTTSTGNAGAPTYSRFGATGAALESSNWMSASGSYTSYTLATATTTLGYWASITPERMILMTSASPSNLMYAGFYAPDPLYAAKAGADIYPLIAARMTDSGIATPNSTISVVTAGIARTPPVAVLGSGGNGWGIMPSVQPATGTVQLAATPSLPSGSTAAYPYVGCIVEVFATTSANPASSPWFGRLGTMRDIVIVPTLSGVVVRGDTFTIGSDTYTTTTGASTAAGFRQV